MTLLLERAVTVGAALVLGLAVAGLAGAQQPQSANPQPAAQAPAAGGGRVIAKGPGYSIVATSPGSGNQPGETSVTDAALETLHEPIICQGQRVLNIDNRNIRFVGNAITAEDGCELHITNSRISASGIAIRARGGSVHIENSEIEGRKASIVAARGAQIYAEASTFRGAARRQGEAVIHDLGNNNWL